MFRVDKMPMEESHPRMLRRSVTRTQTENIASVCKCEAYILLLIKEMMTHFAIIALSASANKLSKIKERADEYTVLIMEEFDPNDLGYIEICDTSPTYL